MKKEVQSIEEALNSFGCITYKVSGKSMMPMIIPDRDIVTVKKKAESMKLNINDVVLYHQKDKLILHRIVEVNTDGKYVILGDNCSRKEYNVSEDDIIGILKSFKHNGVHYETTDIKYAEYVKKLRNSESKRTKRKLIYDIIVQHLDFLPSSLYKRVKSCLRKLIVYQIEFV